MKPKFIASMLCAVSLFLLCSCIHLPSATPDTTDSPLKKMLNASVSIGGKDYPSVDGRGFAENFPTEDVLDEEKRVVKGIDYVLYSGQKKLVSGYRVEYLVFAKAVEKEAKTKELAELARSHGTKVFYMQAGDTVRSKRAAMRCLGFCREKRRIHMKRYFV